jgi:hypothetical protein
MTIEALGNIGAADSSPKLVKLIGQVDKDGECKEMVVKDFANNQLLVCRNSNIIARIIFEIAHIGDYRAVSAMERLSANKDYSESIRKLAGEFVFKMNYAPHHGR